MFFADLWHFTGWVGKGVNRRKVRTEKILPGGNRSFSIRGIGDSQEKDGQRETFGGQREVKIFIVSSRGAGGFSGHAVDGRG